MKVSGVKPAIKSKYCSNKCKQQAYRNRNAPTVTNVTPNVTVRQSVTKAESHIDASQIGVVRALHEHLSAEELNMRAERLKREVEVTAARVPKRWWPIEDYALWIRTNRPDWIPEGYRPADQLGKGEFNKVSKPGDTNYVGVC
jgi:hypothetical protein